VPVDSPTAKKQGEFEVINYRLIVRMVFKYKRIYVKEFLTDAEYNKGRWKKWL